MDVLSKVVKSFSGGVEACLTRSVSDEVVFAGNSFKRSLSGESVKLEVRLTDGKRSAYAWTSNPSKWLECVNHAKRLLSISSDLMVAPPLSSGKGVNSSFISSDIDLTLNGLHDIGLSMINVAKRSGVSSSVNVSREVIKTSFINSLGVSFTNEQSVASASMECSFKGSSSFDYFSSQGFNTDFNLVAEQAVKLCLDSVGAKPVKPERVSVVFGFDAVNSFIEMLSESLNGFNVMSNNSFLAGKLGSVVASDLFSLRDAGVVKGGINNSLMDSEGSRITDRLLIDKGVLKGFFNDNYTGLVLGLPAGNSAGLARRGLVDAHNLIVKPGRFSDEELLRDCIYVNDLMGTHTANTVTGDFALSALNAFRVNESGKRSPVRDLMISGNIFELLKSVSGVGRKPVFKGSFSSPLIKFSGVQVVG